MTNWDDFADLPTPMSPHYEFPAATTTNKRIAVDEHSAAESPPNSVTVSETSSPNGTKQPRRMMLRSSSSSPRRRASPEDAAVAAGGGSDLSSARNVEQIDQLERDLADTVTSPYFTTIEYFRARPAAYGLPHEDVSAITTTTTAERLVPIDALFGTEHVVTMLETYIGRPMANPLLVKSDTRVMFAQAAPGMGLRTAVRSYCAQAGYGADMAAYRCNLITYCYFNHEREIAQGPLFFKLLLALAVRYKPCVLLVHRPSARSPVPHLVYEQLWNAYLPYFERNNASSHLSPDVWLLFADEHLPVRFSPHWGFIEKVSAVTSISLAQKLAVARAVLRRRLSAILAQPQDVDAMLAHYEPHLTGCIHEDNQAMFARPKVIEQFVEATFARWASRFSFRQLRTLGDSIDDDSLPKLQDFRDALHEQIEAYEVAAKQNAARMLAASSSSAPNGLLADPHHHDPRFPPPSRR